jgi:hypothetical protein
MPNSDGSYAKHLAMAVEAALLELLRTLEESGALKKGEARAVVARAGSKLETPLATDDQHIAAGVLQTWLGLFPPS